MRRSSHVLVVVAALPLLGGGCATKGWVQELFGKREAEIDARFTRSDARAGALDTRVESVDESARQARARADGAHGRADEAHGRAEAAYGRADGAHARAGEVDARLTRLWSARHARTLVDTVDVHFGFDRADLSDAAQTALLGVVRELKTNPGLAVDLEGYADPTGAPDYNVALSQRRVESVRRYLVQQGAELPRIHAVGLGPLPATTAEARVKQRRVTVRLMAPSE